MLWHVYIAHGCTWPTFSLYILANKPAVVREMRIHQLSVTDKLFVGMRVRPSAPPPPPSPPPYFFFCGFLCLLARISTWFSFSVYCIVSNRQAATEFTYEQKKTQRHILDIWYQEIIGEIVKIICKVSQWLQWNPEKFKAHWKQDKLLPLKQLNWEKLNHRKGKTAIQFGSFLSWNCFYREQRRRTWRHNCLRPAPPGPSPSNPTNYTFW